MSDIERWLDEAPCSEVDPRAAQVAPLLVSHSIDIRIAVVRALGKCRVGLATIRRAFRFERNELVAAEMAEALSGDTSARSLLRRVLLEDPRYLVRIEAAHSLGVIGDRSDMVFLRSRAMNERSGRVRVAAYGALIRLGDMNALEPFLQLLASKDYVVRCAVANVSADLCIVSDENVTKRLQMALDREVTAAARSSLQAALAACKD